AMTWASCRASRRWFWCTGIFAVGLLLEFTDTSYEEKRYTCGEAPDYDRSQWLDVKIRLDLEFPNLPYLLDGKNKITQNNHDMGGETEEEKIQVDIVENQVMDFRIQLIKLCYSPDRETLKPQYLEQLPGQLKHSSMGEKLTYVDFLTCDTLDQNRIFEPKCLDEFPNLKKIAAYIQSVNFFKMPINNKMAQGGNKPIC
uniref:Glutathione S-transferase n=1 Tax=Cebus imitator TaxID=2715852 RepID=A0A2K5SEK5_CEBIM